jgi:hypothetical protein
VKRSFLVGVVVGALAALAWARHQKFVHEFDEQG